MRRRSLRPPRRGVTHSRYSPPWTMTVSPGRASAAARLIVRKGSASEPAPVSDPVVATWRVDVIARRSSIRRPGRAGGTGIARRSAPSPRALGGRGLEPDPQLAQPGRAGHVLHFDVGL